MADIRMKWNEPALDRLLNQPSGPVGRHMKKIGLKILAGAHSAAGHDTGELKAKLYMRQGRKGNVQYVEVGTKAKHGLVHHEGSKPHQIRPANGRVLRFNVNGRVVYARKVSHPGTRAVRYLTGPMRRVVR